VVARYQKIAWMTCPLLPFYDDDLHDVLVDEQTNTYILIKIQFSMYFIFFIDPLFSLC
jgi:hypothetical protein